MKSNRPVIGIVPDYKEGSKDSYSVRDFYALRINYVEAINHNGGAAIILPYDYGLIDDYLNSIDGILIVGGFFDINPRRYGEETHPKTNLNEVRENFEYNIGQKALKKNLPFFGICNGMHLINILRNGSSIQHIPDHKQYIDHEQKNIPGYDDYSKPYHEVLIENDSQLSKIIKESKIKTNSSHHQAAKKIGNNLQIAAKAFDGIIEAIEDPNHPFLLGIQWHPEFDSAPADSRIFQSFIAAAKIYKQNNR
jgi:putative glutamine amidotransferase